MQNNGRNVDDDYALAMQLQKQFDDEYRTNNNNAINIEEEMGAYGNNDAIALSLQQMYDKKKDAFENGYEGKYGNCSMNF
ncbi:unnamed protein product [Rhizophagus irregularis]|nr:unnamed protein product [Rhizophagus irregularis]